MITFKHILQIYMPNVSLYTETYLLAKQLIWGPIERRYDTKKEGQEEEEEEGEEESIGKTEMQGLRWEEEFWGRSFGL